jgi:hypothetical protein
MKKIICGSIAVLAIAATIVFNVNLNTQSEKLSDISLTNVEALADGESPEQICCNKAFSSEVCIIVNTTEQKGRRHNCN